MGGYQPTSKPIVLENLKMPKWESAIQPPKPISFTCTIAASVCLSKRLSTKRKRTMAKDEQKQSAGHLGGLKGGPARAKKLTKARKEAIAKQGAKARWGVKKTKGS